MPRENLDKTEEWIVGELRRLLKDCPCNPPTIEDICRPTTQTEDKPTEGGEAGETNEEE